MDNVAVCISGLIGKNHNIDIKNVMRNIERNKRLLPYPFFFSHWKGYDFDIPKCLWVEEPEPHYHCILDIEENVDCETWNRYKNFKINRKPGLWQTSNNWTKQMLAHHYLVKTLPSQYTTIIRLRYDSYLNSSIDFKKVVAEVETDGVPIGSSSFSWGDGLQKEDYNTLKAKRHKPKDCQYCKGSFLWDHFMVHKREHLINVDTLYEQKKLRASEWGWWQVLAGQHNINFKNIENLAVIYRKIKRVPNFT